MTTTITDRIERELIVAVPVHQAWQALVDPDLLGQWLGRPTLPVEPGVELELVFGSGDDEFSARAKVVDVREPELVSMRWIPGTSKNWDGVVDLGLPLDELPTTLIELRVEAIDETSSRITVTETGFAALPAQVVAGVLADNTGGWEHCFAKLAATLEDRAVSR